MVFVAILVGATTRPPVDEPPPLPEVSQPQTGPLVITSVTKHGDMWTVRGNGPADSTAKAVPVPFAYPDPADKSVSPKWISGTTQHTFGGYPVYGSFGGVVNVNGWAQLDGNFVLSFYYFRGGFPLTVTATLRDGTQLQTVANIP
jgi:hypothetical protein